MTNLRGIGIMSGTSLDGVDFCCANYIFENNRYSFEIEEVECYEYDKFWKDKLVNAHLISAEELLKLHSEYGFFLGELTQKFIIEKNIWNTDFIASHGHTIFHQPENKFTFQLGHGAAIANKTQIRTVCDFRTEDVLNGGQGAPLVPVGDEFLFSEFDACLNLGGFANISFEVEGKRIAFDVCPVNFVLNALANKIGKTFDENGEIAKNGVVNFNLLNQLNNLAYYQNTKPKSLGREWVENEVFPLLNSSQISVESQISTFTQHIADQLNKIISNYHLNQILVSGGGAYNEYLISLLKHKILLPEKKIIDYKEALIFGFLGFLKINNQINIRSTVTGSQKDSSSGVVYFP